MGDNRIRDLISTHADLRETLLNCAGFFEQKTFRWNQYLKDIDTLELNYNDEVSMLNYHISLEQEKLKKIELCQISNRRKKFKNSPNQILKKNVEIIDLQGQIDRAKIQNVVKTNLEEIKNLSISPVMDLESLRNKIEQDSSKDDIEKTSNKIVTGYLPSCISNSWRDITKKNGEKAEATVRRKEDFFEDKIINGLKLYLNTKLEENSKNAKIFLRNKPKLEEILADNSALDAKLSLLFSTDKKGQLINSISKYTRVRDCFNSLNNRTSEKIKKNENFDPKSAIRELKTKLRNVQYNDTISREEDGFLGHIESYEEEIETTLERCHNENSLLRDDHVMESTVLEALNDLLETNHLYLDNFPILNLLDNESIPPEAIIDRLVSTFHINKSFDYESVKRWQYENAVSENQKSTDIIIWDALGCAIEADSQTIINIKNKNKNLLKNTVAKDLIPVFDDFFLTKKYDKK